MAWGSKDTATQLTTVSTEQFFDDTPTLTPGELAHVQIVGNSSGTTDNLIIAVYTTLDDSTENWDTVPFLELELDCTDGADNDVSFLVAGVYRFRVGVRRSGSTDTFTADMAHRLDGVAL